MNIWQELKKDKPGFLALAPMEDVTDVAFRMLIREIGGADLYFTEFTSAEGMFSPGRDRVTKRLVHEDIEKSTLIAQIWGKTPEKYYEAAKEISELGFAGVDINMGCPAKKIVKQGACSALIANESLAKEVIEATIEGANGKIPVSVKTRIGFRKKVTEEWASFLLGFKIDALTIHGRLAKDMSKYPADWNEVKKVVDIKNKINSDILIIGNGDVMSIEEADSRVKETGVDGVMIGRGIFNDPLLFNKEKSYDNLSVLERIKLMNRHIQLFSKYWGDEKPFVLLRRFLKIYTRGFEGAAELRRDLMEAESYQDTKLIIDNFCKQHKIAI